MLPLRFFALAFAFLVFFVPAQTQEKSLLDDTLGREADAFENLLQTTWPTKGKDAKGWRAEGLNAKKAGEHRAATGHFAASALLDRKNAEAWLQLSEEYLAIDTVQYNEKSTFARNAQSAAYLAFQRATTPEQKARALALIAQSYVARAEWRKALRAYKASLAIAEDESVQSDYDELFNEHGFRMLDYTADNESSSPRVCVQFSDQLAKGRIDYANYVTLNGQKPASVRVQDRQLCVEELLHGHRYEIKIRSGIRSAEDDVLPKAVELTVYIRDRKPSVRLSGRNYVLPRTGQQGIPVISINTKSVKATIYRIGDRRIATEVLDGDFAKPLESYQLSQIAETKGEKLWSGQMAVTMKQNEEVTTAFPVDQLLPNLKPGLYVLSASTAEDKPSRDDEEEEYNSEDGYGMKATQWFVVSDLGLTAFSGTDGVTAFARSLASAEPLPGIEMRLIARNNEILGTAKTDAQGIARFEAGLSKGQGGLSPGLVVARGPDTDYGFLDLTKQAFDLSDRGVGGRAAPGPLDALVFTERGVYRPGETVHITALLRDANANAATNVPLVMRLFRPDGVEFRKETLPDQGDGGRAWSITLPQTSMTGAWRIAAYVDPKGSPLFERNFLVEDYVPERLEMKLTATQPILTPDNAGVVNLAGRYLYGAPASSLAIEGEVVVSAATEIEGYPGYSVGLLDSFANVRKELESLPGTDANGAAKLSIPLPDLPQTSKPLRADVTLRLREQSGRVLSERIGLKVNTGKSFIGVKPLFEGSVSEGDKARFEVVGIGPDGKRVSMQGLHWAIQQLETRYQWYMRDGHWSYEAVTYENKIADGAIDTAESGPVTIEAPVAPGYYRLDIASATARGPATSVTFYSGWYVSDNSDAPEILDLALDRPSYKPGEDVKVQILPRMAGRAMVSIVSDKVLATQMIEVGEKGGSATFKADSSWGPGAYVSVILYRPLDSAAKRMPSRAVGVKWIPLDARLRQLAVELDTPQTVRPAGPVTISASISGLDAGEKATLVISGVDVGILNLTRYKTPAPDSYFLGQRRLALEIRDLYGKLIDGMQGVRGVIRSGGDAGGLTMSGRPAAETPLAVYSGIVQTGRDGKAQVTFTLPPFNGTMRLAAQAWTASKLGHGEKDVIVRDPVVALVTPPKFLMLGDTSTVHLSLENAEAPPGDYNLAVTAENGLSARDGNKTLTLERNKRIGLSIPLFAASVGEGRLSIALNGPGNTSVQRNYTIRIEPPAPNVRRSTTQVLAANDQPLRVAADSIRDLVPVSARISVMASKTAAFDVPGLLLSLSRYPYGCAEQTTSRALPLLYYEEVAAKARIGKDANLKSAIEKAIARLAEMQSASGSFGLWGPGREDIWLTAYVSDFLTRAKEKGYTVRPEVYDIAIDRLKNAVANARDFDKGGEELAYALYVLTRAGRGVLGDLRYYTDTKIENFSTPLARAQLGAALAMLGDKERAERAFASAAGSLSIPSSQVPGVPLAFGRSDYGTALRDAAAVIALMGESGITNASMQKAIDTVVSLRSLQRDTTTQESLWLLLAARSLDTQNRDLSLDVNGARVRGAFQTVLAGSDIALGAIRVSNVNAAQSGAPHFETVLSAEQFSKDGLQIKNAGAEAVPTSVLVTGEGTEAEPAAENGFKIERRVYTPDGREISFDRVKQNERVVVVLRATEVDPRLGEIIVEDRLPAGFDIENPALLKGTDLKAFNWLPTTYTPVFTSFRDDRFIAAFSLKDTGRKIPAQLTMAYVMRAVSPGIYTHAGVRVEDMYRPDRFARTAGSKVEVVAAQ